MKTIMNMYIHIEKSGTGKQHVVLLHGWGQCTKAFQGVQQFLENDFTVYNVDLPGFGLSDKPTYPFNTEDYADFIHQLVTELDIKQPIIIGHSFGGRVAIKYTAKYQHTKKLILVDSAGIVNKKGNKYYIKVYTYKILKRLFSLPILKRYKACILKKFGSSDYKNADETMRKILVQVVNEDLRMELKQINCPTLLVWGTKDTATPLNDAYIMKEHLKDAGIVKIENAGHFSYLENINLFLKVLNVFLKEDK